MNTTYFCVTICAITSIVWGWTAVELTDNSVDHPGYCYSKTEKIGAMAKGEERLAKGECYQVVCGEDTNIYYYGCGLVEGSDVCKVTEVDLTKPFPKCCPRLEC